MSRQSSSSSSKKNQNLTDQVEYVQKKPRRIFKPTNSEALENPIPGKLICMTPSYFFLQKGTHTKTGIQKDAFNYLQFMTHKV